MTTFDPEGNEMIQGMEFYKTKFKEGTYLACSANLLEELYIFSLR